MPGVRPSVGVGSRGAAPPEPRPPFHPAAPTPQVHTLLLTIWTAVFLLLPASVHCSAAVPSAIAFAWALDFFVLELLECVFLALTTALLP